MSPSIPTLVLEAITFAARAHRSQVRKDRETPYAAHTFRVCLIVREVFGIVDPEVLATAVLHDAIEDTTTDYDDLLALFGERVASWVAALSKDKRLREPEREAEYAERLRQAPWQVGVCKLADVLDNWLDSAHLSEPQRQKTRLRAEFYLEQLAHSPHPEVHSTVEVVRSALEDKQDGADPSSSRASGQNDDP